VCYFSQLILHISKRSGVLFDHIADFLKFISSAQSFWFLLDTSYNHGCHLASCFRLDPDKYEALLILAGLASYTRFGFQIKADAWRKFLSGRWFVADDCPIEFEQKKIDLNAYINGKLPSRLQQRKFYVVVAVTLKATAAAMAAVATGAAGAAGAVTATMTTMMMTMTTTTMAVMAAAEMTTAAAATQRRWQAHTTIN
jgi:hypothetical protein